MAHQATSKVVVRLQCFKSSKVPPPQRIIQVPRELYQAIRAEQQDMATRNVSIHTAAMLLMGHYQIRPVTPRATTH